MILTIDENECRNCGMPKSEVELPLMACDRCDALTLQNYDNVPYLVSRILVAPPIDLYRSMQKVPVAILFTLAHVGMKMAELEEFENIHDLPCNTPPLSKLLERLDLTTESGICKGCGRNHSDDSDSYMHYDPQSRIGHYVSGTDTETIMHGILSLYYEKYSRPYMRELGKAGEVLQCAIAQVHTKAWETELPPQSVKDERIQESLKHIISMRACGEGSDYLAQALLARIGLNSSCSPERLLEVAPHDTVFAIIEKQLHEEDTRARLSSTNQSAREHMAKTKQVNQSLHDLISRNIG
jgi:hypothetical protein